jgi:hypothetical protein
MDIEISRFSAMTNRRRVRSSGCGIRGKAPTVYLAQAQGRRQPTAGLGTNAKNKQRANGPAVNDRSCKLANGRTFGPRVSFAKLGLRSADTAESTTPIAAVMTGSNSDENPSSADTSSDPPPRSSPKNRVCAGPRYPITASSELGAKIGLISKCWLTLHSPPR